jgi:hypothetical protein
MDTVFERDTAVRRIEADEANAASGGGRALTGGSRFAADVASGWRAGRGPHYDYRAPDESEWRIYLDGRIEPK